MTIRKEVALQLFLGSYECRYFNDQGYNFLTSPDEVDNIKSISTHLDYIVNSHYANLDHLTNYGIRSYLQKLQIVFNEIVNSLSSQDKHTAIKEIFFTYFKTDDELLRTQAESIFKVSKSINNTDYPCSNFASEHAILKNQEYSDSLQQLLYQYDDIESGSMLSHELINKVNQQFLQMITKHLTD